MTSEQKIKEDCLWRNWRRHSGFGVISLIVFLNSISLARSQGSTRSDDLSASLPKFDAVSIRPSSNAGGTMLLLTPDGISATNIPLQLILRQAFGVEDDRIVGAPGWVNTKRYDIQAKVTVDDAPALRKLSREQRFAMLQSVLQDRFELKFHREIKELQGYALVVARGGPKIKESSPENPTETNSFGQRHLSLIGNGRLESKSTQIGNLAHQLSFILGGQTVVDKTGLTGNYDYTLQWTPDNTAPMAVGPGVGEPGSETAPSAESGPSIFTALQEQLGLKLQSEKVRADVIAIDQIEPPTAN
jgi:bla regulator protein blaR1